MSSINCVLLNNSLTDLLTLDYDNAITLNQNASFTPNSNGYVMATGISTSTYGNLAICLGNSYNKPNIICISQLQNGYNLGINCLVSKGQTYYLYNENVTIHYAKFIPFK